MARRLTARLGAMRRRHQDAGRDPDTAQWFIAGAPAADSTVSVSQVSTAGAGMIRAADPSFDPDAFLAWAGSVYRRATAAWSTKDPEVLRPVMTEQVWDPYAEYLLSVSALALGREVMASAVAAASLTGADADATSQSVLISFEVTITGPRASLFDEQTRHWQERWLFQRPAGSRTHASGMVAVCLVCGGPADVADSGRCPYCHADITTRTAGWLVTQVATSMPNLLRIGIHRGAGATVAPPRQPPRAL